MSASGFTPCPSTTSAASFESPATSSSHQPPTKSLRALEAETASDDTPAKVLAESTDEELYEAVAQPVPAVPEEKLKEELHEDDGYHDADDFVPCQDRQRTLEGSSGPEVFVIGADEKEEGEENALREGPPEVPLAHQVQKVKGEAKEEGAKGSPRTSATEQEALQPARRSFNVLSQSSSSSSACARAQSSPPSQSDELGFCRLFKRTHDKLKINLKTLKTNNKQL